jgi:hypothetical protein
MMAAASTRRGLAAEFTSAANSYETVISQLTGEGWMGPASASMTAAAAPYLAWMSAAASQAEQAATQATAAAAAFDAAFAATVPPPLIAANRAQLATLVATNVLGQNTAAIAANEAHYPSDVGPRRRSDVRLRRLLSNRIAGSTRLPNRARAPTRPDWPVKPPRSPRPPALLRETTPN